MTRIVIETRGFQELVKSVQQLDRPLRPMMETLAFEMDRNIETFANPHPGADKGVFSRGGHGESIKRDVSPGEIPAFARAYTNSPIVVQVDEGRKPGQRPPMRAIRRWASRHGIPDKRGKKKPYFYIARSIGQKGSKPVHMFERGAKVSERELPTLIHRAEAEMRRIWDSGR